MDRKWVVGKCDEWRGPKEERLKSGYLGNREEEGQNNNKLLPRVENQCLQIYS